MQISYSKFLLVVAYIRPNQKDWQMSFNASKCEVIRVTRKQNPIKTTYTIHGHDLTVNKTGKYLGVTIADNLTWNAHVDATSKKANNSLAFLRRNLASCPRDIKAQSYQALVRPILEYASTSWDPYTKSNIQQLEAVQRRAARFLTGDYRTTSSPSQMIADLEWEPLYQRRANFKLVMVYRITYAGLPYYIQKSAAYAEITQKDVPRTSENSLVRPKMDIEKSCRQKKPAHIYQIT